VRTPIIDIRAFSPGTNMEKGNLVVGWVRMKAVSKRLGRMLFFETKKL